MEGLIKKRTEREKKEYWFMMKNRLGRNIPMVDKILECNKRSDIGKFLAVKFMGTNMIPKFHT